MTQQGNPVIFNGLSRGVHPINQPAEQLWDAHNIRITARENETYNSITNEKSSNRLLTFYIEGFTTYYVGHEVCKNYLVYFLKYINDDISFDVIYRINLDNTFTPEVLYRGDLNLDPQNPIKSVFIYETSLLQKIYWVDNVNPPRMINITKPELLSANYDTTTTNNVALGYTSIYTDAPFNFVPLLTLEENCSITHKVNSNSLFPAGAIQYVLTYSYKYGQESNPFYTSEILYCFSEDKGTSPEDLSQSIFLISLSNIDTRFDYVNIYSILRTSIDTTPVVKRVTQLPISNSSLTFSDNNSTGEIVDSSYFKYNTSIIAKAICTKDNVLFLGNITNIVHDINSVDGVSDLIDWLSSHINTSTRTHTFQQNVNYYSCQLSENTSYFQGGEEYRLGIQFQYKTGEWSDPIFIKDYTVDRETARPTITFDSNIAILTIPQILGHFLQSTYDDRLSSYTFSIAGTTVTVGNAENGKNTEFTYSWITSLYNNTAVDFTATSSESWLTIENISVNDEGKGTYTIVVEENEFTSTRSATITFIQNTSNKVLTLTVTQSAALVEDSGVDDGDLNNDSGNTGQSGQTEDIIHRVSYYIPNDLVNTAVTLVTKGALIESVTIYNVGVSGDSISEDEILETFDNNNVGENKAITYTFDTEGFYYVDYTFVDIVGTTLETDEFARFFENCATLYSVSNGFFNFLSNDYNENVTDLSYVFSGCTSLVSLPKYLFSFFGYVLTFEGCFKNCESLNSLPDYLFWRYDSISDQEVFEDTIIPCTDFSYCFYGCISLVNIREDLFENTVGQSFDYCFYGCTKLSDEVNNCEAIPDNLFPYTALGFSYCFYNAGTDGSLGIFTSSSSSRVGPFALCTNAYLFDYCFYGALYYGLPTRLLAYSTAITSMKACFALTSSRSITVNLLLTAQNISNIEGNTISSTLLYKQKGHFYFYVIEGSTTYSTLTDTTTNTYSRCGDYYTVYSLDESDIEDVDTYYNDYLTSASYSARKSAISSTVATPEDVSTVVKILKNLVSEGYYRVRPVVVFPQDYERNIILQGIINPTVFQVGARKQNTPHSFASWNFRPMGTCPNLQKSDDSPNFSRNFKHTYDYVNTSKNGSIVEWRHYRPLLAGNNTGAEIPNMAIAENMSGKTGLALKMNEDKNGMTKFQQKLWYVKAAYRIESAYARSFNTSYGLMPSSFNLCAYCFDLKIVNSLLESSGYVDYIWYVDQSVATLNSPDIELGEIVTMNKSNNYLYLVGLVQFDYNYGNFDADLATVQACPDSVGVLPTSLKTTGSYSMVSGFYYKDGMVDDYSSDSSNIRLSNYKNTEGHNEVNWFCHLWEKTGSLNNDVKRTGTGENSTTEGTQTALIKYHKQSNYHITKPVDWFTEDSYLATNKLKVKDWSIFNQETISIEKLDDDYMDFSLLYMGNVDIVNVSPNLYKRIFVRDGNFGTFYDQYTIQDSSESDSEKTYYTVRIVESKAYVVNDNEELYIDSDLNVYTYSNNSFVLSNTKTVISRGNLLDMNAVCYLHTATMSIEDGNTSLADYLKSIVLCSDPVSISFKSSPHLVFNMDYMYSFGGTRLALPRIMDNSDVEYNLSVSDNSVYNSDEVIDNHRAIIFPYSYSNYITSQGISIKDQFWMSLSRDAYLRESAIDKDEVEFINNTNEDYDNSYLYIGEIRRTNQINKFGGYDSSGNPLDLALMSNIWLPAGEAVSIQNLIDILEEGANKDTGEEQLEYTINNNCFITWKWGDTWYQNFDTLKTYPFSEEATNQIVEIASFYVETHLNIDGRYDNNRGLTNNINVRPTNFNKFNKVYTQKNNYFSYSILDKDFYKNNEYNTMFIWSNSKTYSEGFDSFTRITQTNSQYLPGQNLSLINFSIFNHNLYVFQEKAFSQIPFNNRSLFDTSSGTVEVAQSKIVDTAVVLYNVGCQDPFSILSTQNSMYFIDYLNNQIYGFGSQGLISLSLNNGTAFFIKDNKEQIQWRLRPSEDYSNYINGIRLYYDFHYSDVYAVPGASYLDSKYSNPEALVFSEQLSRYTSMMSYGGSVMFHYNGKQYAFAYSYEDDYLSLYELYSPEINSYNTIFDKVFPFSISFVAINNSPSLSKIFDNIEMRADSYDYVNDSLELIDDTYSISEQAGMPFDYIQVQNEYQDTGIKELNTDNFRKKFRVWRAQIPRGEGLNYRGQVSRERINNPWSMITLGKANPGTSHTILHNINLLYS